MQFVRDKLYEIAVEENPDTSMQPGQVLEGLDVLDVGCGGGLLTEVCIIFFVHIVFHSLTYLTQSLARTNAKTTGIDASQSNIAIASLHAQADPRLRDSGNIKYLHTSAETLLEEPKRYDVVCSMEVLEHVDNPSQFLATCAELVKVHFLRVDCIRSSLIQFLFQPGGHLFLSTISRTPLAYALTILMAEDILRKVSSGTHTYSKFVKPSELVQFFREYRSSPPTSEPATPPTIKPWITTPASASYLPRTEAELRGLIYNPLAARWHLAPRDAWGALECNYIFWVRKPKI